MTSGAITLGQISLSTLQVGCTKCGRKGHYQVTRLIAGQRQHQGLPDLAAKLSADCPRRLAGLAYDRCQIYFPNLAGEG